LELTPSRLRRDFRSSKRPFVMRIGPPEPEPKPGSIAAAAPSGSRPGGPEEARPQR
jgi:hypothetical protein